MKNVFLSKKVLISVFFSIILLLVVQLLPSKELITVACAVCMLSFFFVCLLNLNDRFLCMLFGGTCFAFLFGSILFGENGTDYINFENYKKYASCLILVFIGLEFGIGFSFIEESNSLTVNDDNVKNSHRLFRYANIAFWLTIPLRIIYICLRARIAIQMGYTYLYYHPEVFNSGQYAILSDIASINNICFVLVLAMMPKLKQVKKILVAEIICDALLMFSGARANMLKSLLLIISFWFLQKYSYSGKTIPYKNVFRIIVAIGIGAFVMSAVFGYIVSFRTGVDATITSNPITTLLGNEGGSWNVVINTFSIYDKTDFLMHLKLYFGPLIHTVTMQFILDKIGLGFVTAKPYTEQYALSAMDYSHYYTYVMNPSLYLTGGGLGSSFLAESYFFGRYFGVLFHAILVGAVLTFFARHKFKTVWGNFYMLTVLNNIYWSARGSALSPFFSVFSFSTVFILMVFWIVGRMEIKIGDNS